MAVAETYQVVQTNQNFAGLSKVTLLLSYVSFAALVGCGNSDFAAVTGVVTLNGTPLDGGSILFSPETSGPLAFGTIASDGTYEMQSAGGVKGLRPGKYIATVTHRSGRPSPGMTLAQIQALEKVPIRYTTPETSDLHTEALPGENKIDLELTSKP